ncbi:MAG: DUF4340 domain-containing protein [Acidobacteria bacterium]|nr:MAG: DUF4340 domain-containing protein [Acidobacteriota bacterium]
MNKKYLQTLIALAVLAILWGAFTYFGRKKPATGSEAKSVESKKILPLNNNQIVAFTVTSTGDKPVTCAHEGNTWQITDPARLAADSSTISSFLTSLTSAVPDDVISEKPDSLKEFGLDPAATTIEVKTNASPQEFTLRLGSSTPTNNGIYAQVAGQGRVFTLASYLKDSLEKKLFDFRNKKVVTLDRDSIRRVDVSSKKDSYQLVKNADGIWDLTLPPPVRADHFSVESLVDELGNASMQGIVAENKKDLGRYGFSNPTMTIHLTSDTGGETLVLGKKEGANYYAMNSALGTVFTLGSDFLSQFQKQPSDLRSKDLFTFSTYEVNQITLQGPKGRRVFMHHKNDKWEQTEPASMEISVDKMQTLLQDLRDLSAQSFPKKDPTDLAAYGLTKPEYTVQVQYGDDKKTQAVQISQVGNNVYARQVTDLVPAELPKDTVTKFQKDLDALK